MAELLNLYETRASREDMVSALEALLEMAKRGEVLSLGMASILAGNSLHYAIINPQADRVALIGQLRVITAALEHEEATRQNIIDPE